MRMMYNNVKHLLVAESKWMAWQNEHMIAQENDAALSSQDRGMQSQGNIPASNDWLYSQHIYCSWLLPNVFNKGDSHVLT